MLSDPSQLTVDVAITLKDAQMRDAFMAAIAGRAYPNLQVNGTTVSFTFDQPFAVPQPPKPAPVLAAIHADNQAIVDKYNSFDFPSNDPNDVQAEFLDFVGLGMLHLADYYGRTASQLAIEIGKDVASIVATLGDRVRRRGQPRSRRWLSGVSQAFADLGRATSRTTSACRSTSPATWRSTTRNGSSDLVLAGQTATHGSYVVGPPSRIPQGTRRAARPPGPEAEHLRIRGHRHLQLRDANLAMKTVVFSFAVPDGLRPQPGGVEPAGLEVLREVVRRERPVEQHGAGRRPPAVRRLRDERPAAATRRRADRHPDAPGRRRQDPRPLPSGRGWSPIAVRDAIAEIRRGDHRYVAVDTAGGRSRIVVVNGRHGPYLRTRADATAQNNLAQLPAC